MKLSREKIVQQAARAGRRTLQLGEEAGGRIRRLSKRSWLILAGIAVLIVGGLWWWLRPEPVKPILPVVQVEPAETDDIELYGEYVGRIRAQQFVEIRARVEGFLEKMLFEEGTYVKKGQPLFIIDPKLYEARVNKAKAQLNKDKALELKADRDLKRIRPLYEQNAASQLDLDNAIASYESATASVAMSEADLTQAETALSGQLYRQFTITIAVSVLISTFVALTLSPALCALILRPDSGKRKNRLFRRINIWLGSGTKFYERMIRGGVRHSKRMLALFGLTLVALWALNKIVPQSFMPQEDQGYFTVELELPEGATLERTRRVTDRAMKYLMSLEDVEYVLNVTGSSPRVGTNQSRSQLTVILKPWEERKSSNIRRLMNDIREEMRRYPESKVYLSTPPVIPGLGASGGFEMVLEARGNASYGDLQRAVDTLLHYASKRKELTGLSSSMQSDIPQLYFDVDRDKAQMLGVPMADIFSTMKTFTGSVYVNDFNMFNRIYRVYIQAEAPYRAQRENLGLFFVRGADKAMIPITALGTTSYTTGPGTIRRFNMFNAATISGEAAQGYSSGQAMAILEQIARRHLPSTIGVEWSGLSYQEKHVSGQTGYVLALAFLFVFLFLAAQYESWLIPVAVILSLPIAGIGAYLGNWACGLENNIYFQIGLVMLVGLVAKNAILIVEFAKDEVEKGRDILTAVILAARLRFRPIVMTSLAFILGMLPLVFASGPGSASRQGIGTGVFFGMLVAITVGIVFVPLFFVWVYKLKEKWTTR